MKSELTKTITERNRYRDLLYKRVIDDEIARTTVKFGGRSKVIAIVVEPQLAVREIGNQVRCVCDRPSYRLRACRCVALGPDDKHAQLVRICRRLR